jgi:hypothetical protein
MRSLGVACASITSTPLLRERNLDTVGTFTDLRKHVSKNNNHGCIQAPAYNIYTEMLCLPGFNQHEVVPCDHCQPLTACLQVHIPPAHLFRRQSL